MIHWGFGGKKSCPNSFTVPTFDWDCEKSRSTSASTAGIQPRLEASTSWIGVLRVWVTPFRSEYLSVTCQNVWWIAPYIQSARNCRRGNEAVLMPKRPKLLMHFLSLPCVSPSRPHRFWGPPSLLSNSYQSGTGSKANHSQPTSADFKNTRSVQHCPIRLHVVMINL
jgi:hypothetical protein